ncbi:MAG: OmpH family outer membrane protein [Chitinispirillia bacterium]|nr:OmpH family outer membrane protein [Chitinispirillia bacterium]MCL2267905.1 OmpH family outer membrane protein [Chitinispirillia bacterium]
MMRGFKAAVLVFFAAAAFSTASAQLKIGFVNSEKIFTQFEGTKVAQDQFNKEVARWEQEASRRAKSITDLREQLEKQSLLLSAERKKSLEDSLRQMIITHEKFLQEKFGQRGEVLTKNEQLTKPILEKIQRIIDRIAKDEQFDFIFDWRSGGLVFAKPAYDLTDKVLAQLAKEK